MAVLDPGMEVGRRDPVAEAQRPVGASQSRVRGTDEPADGDQDEGRHGSGDRKLGKSGHIGFLWPPKGHGSGASPW